MSLFLSLSLSGGVFFWLLFEGCGNEEWGGQGGGANFAYFFSPSLHIRVRFRTVVGFYVGLETDGRLVVLFGFFFWRVDGRGSFYA